MKVLIVASHIRDDQKILNERKVTMAADKQKVMEINLK